MSYQSDTIATVVRRLNVQYFLPAIQREFVWKTDQVVQLFDSILRGYPISSFLFWELDEANREKWEIYRFIEDFDERRPHNSAGNAHGVQQLTMVLDGQQRLTSLLIGLRGTYTSKEKRRRWDNPNAFVKERLYLDLLKDSTVADDDVEIGVRYGFAFLREKPAPDAEHYWFPVGKILDFDGQGSFDAYLDQLEEQLPDATTRGQARLIRRNLTRLREAIWRDEVIAYYTEHEQDYDRVLEIFVRANEGGTKLSKSDLLLSMVIARWGGMSARQEIFGFVDELNGQLTRRNSFDKDFVMKSCLVLSDLPVAYLVRNFNNPNLELIRQNWEGIKTAMRSGIDLVNSYGIDRDTLTSANALIPVLYFLYTHTRAAPQHGTTTTDAENALIIRRWVLMALLNNVFAGASDAALAATRRVMQAHRDDALFPAEEIGVELARSGRLTQFNDQAIANILDIHYGEREAFLALSLLYDDNTWGTMTYHQDHIFPRSHFDEGHLAAAGIPPEQHERYRNLANRLGNLELLSGPENVAKSNQDFAMWVSTRSPDFKRRHLIPTDDTLLSLEHFEQFIAAREALIRERLAGLFGPAQRREAIDA